MREMFALSSEDTPPYRDGGPPGPLLPLPIPLLDPLSPTNNLFTRDLSRVEAQHTFMQLDLWTSIMKLAPAKVENSKLPARKEAYHGISPAPVKQFNCARHAIPGTRHRCDQRVSWRRAHCPLCALCPRGSFWLHCSYTGGPQAAGRHYCWITYAEKPREDA